MGKPNKRLSAVDGDPSNKKHSGSDETVTAESNKVLSTISGIDQLLSGIGSFDDKAVLMVEKMAQAADADWVAFLIPDERLSGLRMVASSGHATQLSPPPQVLPYDQGITGRAFTSGKSIVTNNNPKHADALEHHIAAGEKSTLALPIMFDGIVIGIFIFGSRKSGHFTDQRVGILETVGNQLGPLLENAKLHQELAAIDEIARTITTTLDIDQVYEQFAAELKKLVEFDRIAIDIIEPDGEEFIVKYIYGEELAGRQKGDVGPVQGNQIQLVVETKETLLRGNIADSPDWPMNRAALKAGLPSLTLVPLITKGRVIGCLGLRSRNINPHGSREIVILQRLASQIAPAIENARLFEASQRAESENALLAEIGRVISSSLDINKVYEHFADTVSSLIEFDRIGIILVDEGKNSLSQAYFAGTKVAGRENGDISPLAGTQVEEVLRTGDSSLLDYENEGDVEREFPGLLPAFAAGLRSFLMVPLFSKDEVMGVMVLKSKQLRAFSKRDVVLAMKIGYQIAPFVECSRLHEDLRKSAAQLAIGAQIAAIITSAADIGELYEMFAGEMRRLVDFDRLTIIQVDTDAKTFTPVFIAGIQIDERRVGMICPLEGTVTQFIVNSGRTFLEGMIEDHEAITAGRSDIKKYFQSSISVPLRTEGKITSTVHLHSVNPGAYGTREMTIIERYADRIAPAIEIARLHEETIRLADETAVIAEIGKIISSSLDIEEVYERFTAEVSKLLQFDRIVIRLLDHDQINTNISYSDGIDVPDHSNRGAVPVAGRTQIEEILRTRKPSLIQLEEEAELEKYPVLRPPYDAGLRSFLMVPMFSNDKIIGVLFVRSINLYAYTQHDVDLLSRVGNQIAGAIANSQLYEERKQAEEKERAAAAESSTLAEIGKIISSSLDIDEVYARVTEEARKVIRFDRMSVSLVDYDHHETVQTYASGVDIPGRMRGDRTPLAGALAGEVALTRSSILFEAKSEEEVLNRFPLLMPAFCSGLRSFISVPLVERDSVTGVVQIRSSELGIYGPRELAITERIADQIAGALANARLYEDSLVAQEEQRRLAQETSVIAEIGRVISSSLDINEVYERVSEEVKQLIPFDRLTVTIIDATRGVSNPTYIAGTNVSGRKPGDSIEFVGTLNEEVVRTRTPIMIAVDSESDLMDRLPGLLPAFHAGLRSFLAVPLVNRNHVLGVFRIGSKQCGIYSQQHLDLAERIGNQIAGAIANAELYKQTKQAEEAERQRSQELSGLLKVSNILAQPGSFQDKVSRVMEELASICDADGAVFRVPDDEGLRRVGFVGEQEEDETIIPYEDNVSALVYGQNEILIVNDYANHPLAVGFHALRGIASVIGVPVVSKESVVGVVTVSSYNHRHFTPERVSLVVGIINGLGSLLETARLEDERSQAEQDLRESEGRFRQISENMREIVFLIDHQDHKLLYVNQAFKELWGHPGRDFYEQPLLWLESVHPDDRPAVEAALAIQTSTGEFEVEYRIIRPDGTVRRIYDRTFPILNESGEVYRIVGIAEDITERKRTEERLHETARLASIGELAAGVAHEINNPLTSVIGYSEMVLHKELPENISEDIQTIYEEAQRAAKIVQNLLFFARRRDTKKQYLDLNSVLIRSLEMKSYDFKVKNIDVVTSLLPGNQKTMIDEHQMVQVFLNILTNAEQAMYQAAGKGRIEVRVVSSDQGIDITVKDDGPGIPAKDLNRIFEPFFTTKEVGQGTGLGLSISYGIIKQHGGDIWVESGEGDGTIFHITVPVVAPEDLETSEIPSLESAERTTKHILVVDDEPQIRNLLGKYLESERFTVDLAEDGQEAWRKLASVDYDCILLDLRMPGMSGPELYELIKEISEALAFKVVFVTGDTVSAGMRDFIAATGNPVVAKPFRMAELLRTIQELWDRMPATV